MKDYKYIVCIRCVCYNQSSYIEQALNSFCDQNTSFPFVCAILDDASTDGMSEIIKGFIEHKFNLEDKTVSRQEETDDYIMVYAQHKTKENCFIAYYMLKYNHYKNPQTKGRRFGYIEEFQKASKYIAICEGDDYWTCGDKLQKQVAFMDYHPEYSACTSNAIIVNEKGEKKGLFSHKQSRDITQMDEIVIQRQFHTASVLHRSSDSIVGDRLKKDSWDTLLWCWLLTRGKIWYDDNITCVYRKAGQGVTSTTSRLKWIETNERWSNILFEQFHPRYLSYTGAYLSLTRDILTSLIQGGLPKGEKAQLRQKYRKYSNVKMDLLNIPFVLRLYRNKIIRLIKKK